MFTDEQKKVLERYFTSAETPIFALINLPEVIKGTLFSRYSRTAKDIRQLFLDEFLNSEVLDTYFKGAGGSSAEDAINTQKANEFYERILVGYGDDSVAELGGAHVALEEISILATKSVEEHRIGLSPLEKSTRYVYYNQKVNGEYNYYRDERIMAGPHRDLYIKTCDGLFDAYSTIVKEIQPVLKEVFPGNEQEAAYKFSIRAKACDLARGLLPLSAKTNMGIYGNGRAFEYLLTNLLNDPLTEVKDAGEMLNVNLQRVISAFIKRATNERGDQYRAYLNATASAVSDACASVDAVQPKASGISVRLVEADANPVDGILTSMIYARTSLSFEQAKARVDTMAPEQKEELFGKYTSQRKNRHHKPGREFEHPYFTFEVVADWGVYKDLMRHRVLTRHHQLFTNDLGYWIPDEVAVSEFSDLYTSAMDQACEAYSILKKDFPHEAQYVVTHGSYNRFVMRMNLRAIIHMTELRASPQGHPTYRKVAQEMVRRVSEQFPLLGKHCFSYVDFQDYALERLDAFRKIEKKAATAGVKGLEE